MKFDFDFRKLRKVCRGYGVVAVYVHGSREKGYAAAESDTDVAVVVEDRRVFKNLDEELDFIGRVEDVLGAKNPDVKVVEKDGSTVFLFEVVKSGRLIFESDYESRVAFEAKVMRRYYDTEKMHAIYRKYLYADILEAKYAN